MFDRDFRLSWRIFLFFSLNHLGPALLPSLLCRLLPRCRYPVGRRVLRRRKVSFFCPLSTGKPSGFVFFMTSSGPSSLHNDLHRLVIVCYDVGDYLETLPLQMDQEGVIPNYYTDGSLDIIDIIYASIPTQKGNQNITGFHLYFPSAHVLPWHPVEFGVDRSLSKLFHNFGSGQ